jgi:hypothetical protein
MTISLYGYTSDDLEAVRGLIERALSLTLNYRQTRYRSFYGAGLPGAEMFILQRNRDRIDDELMEEGHPHMQLLLYVIHSPHTIVLEQLLIDITGACLLERRDEA